MNNGRPHEPDASSPFARHDGHAIEPGDESAARPGERAGPRLEDSLDAFGSESEPDPFPSEAPRAATAAKPAATVAPRAAAPAALPAAASALLARLARIRIPAIPVAPLWLSVAAIGGVIIGVGYARYVRPADPVSPAAPTVTEAPRTAGSTGTVPPPPTTTPAPAIVAPTPAVEPRPPARPPVVEPPPRPRSSTTPRGVETRGPETEALAPSALSGLPSVPAASQLATPSAPAPRADREESESARDQRVIASILDAYRMAYERLDPEAVAALWSGVDRSALTRTFGALSSQRMSFSRCDIVITGAVAVARCDGSLTSTRRDGGPEAQSRAMAWAFALERASGQWRISGVNAR